MARRPLQRLEAANGAPDGNELADAESLHQRTLRVDDVANGDEWETHAIGAPGEWIIGRRSGCPLASAKDVGADDERVVRIERPPRADEGIPPAAGTSRQAVAGERVQDENRIVACGVQASPGTVGNRDRLDVTAELQIDRSDLHREARGIEHGRRLAAPAHDPQPASVAELLFTLNGV